MSLIVSRLAPTPNGEIHWGNLMNYALTWQQVRSVGGKLWLRFDDIDQARCLDSYKVQTRSALEFLGINWDEETSGQTLRIKQYKNFLTQLPHYVCNCSRQDILTRTGGNSYDGHCRHRKLVFTEGETAIRFLSPRSVNHDFILWRKEDLPAYHLTSLYDDMIMGTSLIIRGEDLRESSEVQKDLSSCLSNDPLSKVRFIHHKLLLNEDGVKLSKSRRDGDLAKKIDSGESAKAIWQDLAIRMSLPETVTSAKEFLNADISRVLE